MLTLPVPHEPNSDGGQHAKVMRHFRFIADALNLVVSDRETAAARLERQLCRCRRIQHTNGTRRDGCNRTVDIRNLARIDSEGRSAKLIITIKIAKAASLPFVGTATTSDEVRG